MDKLLMKILPSLFISLLLVGCANLDQGGAKVRLVSQEFVEKNNCKFVSAVSNSIDYFGDDWQVALRNEVAKAGGNALVIQITKDYVISKTGSGEAYSCKNS